MSAPSVAVIGQIMKHTILLSITTFAFAFCLAQKKQKMLDLPAIVKITHCLDPPVHHPAKSFVVWHFLKPGKYDSLGGVCVHIFYVSSMGTLLGFMKLMCE